MSRRGCPFAGFARTISRLLPIRERSQIGSDHEAGRGRSSGRAGSECRQRRSEIQLIPCDEAYEPGFEDMNRRTPNLEKRGQKR